MNKDYINAYKKAETSMNSVKSSHEIVRELYADFNVRGIRVGRAINSKATARGKVGEVIAT